MSKFANLLSGILRPGGEEEGKEHPETPDVSPEQELAAARKGKPTLLEAEEGAVSKLIRKRWDRHDESARKLQAQLKVNFLRYQGNTFAQVHPEDPNRVFIPAGAKQRLPPSINKLRRTVHRYQAQVTADEPLIEGIPATHSDRSRDAAEAATHVLQGEWQRMKLHNELQRTVQTSAVLRSGFWFFEFDGTAGGRVKAQKFFTNPQGERYLGFVDASGNEVQAEEEAAEIWQGHTKVHILSPTQVRFEGARYAHQAPEVMVGMMVTLRELYEMQPKAREVKLCELLTNVPADADSWLTDLHSESPKAKRAFEEDDLENITGNDLEEEDTKLDAKVFLLHYFRKPGRTYQNGFHAIVVGKYLLHRGALRYKVIPVAQFKLLDDLAQPLGLSLVDLLKDPQELLDFVNGQILRYLQSLKRRYFVPMHSQVKARDLLNPTRSIIEYNPQAGKPEPEQGMEIPHGLSEWVDRFERGYDDEAGLHDTMQGKHVPGVTSGRHAEALRAGDETILGLTRMQIQEGLEAAGRIILEIAKVEWGKPRRVQYFGRDRDYVDEAFSAVDLGDCFEVRLAKGTLLMQTPAQKLETLYGYVEMQALTPEDVRRLAPITDTAGVSLSEDPHYRRARRQNSRFLAGPPADLLAEQERHMMQSEMLSKQIQDMEAMLGSGLDPDAIQPAIDKIKGDLQTAQGEWEATLQKYAPSHRAWEDDPLIARIHYLEHQRALASDKVDRFPEWWVEMFEKHAVSEYQIANPQASPPPPTEPNMSMNFKDLPPEGMIQMAEKVGIKLEGIPPAPVAEEQPPQV